MNLYKFHSNPDELIGYTDRDFYFGDEAQELILQGKEVTKVVVDDLQFHTRHYDDGTPITSPVYWLPDNLTVQGDLNIRYTHITSLPDNLTVSGYLDLRNLPITSLGNNLKVGSHLYLDGTDITSLPDNLTVQGSLNISDTQIKSLPDNLTVHGDLYLGFTPNLDKNNLPSSLAVKGKIHK